MADDLDPIIDTKSASQDDGYVDPKNQYPKREYNDTSSANLAARGLKTNELHIGGGYENFSLDLKDNGVSQYPLNQVRETESGHITEVDDTPENERLLWMHKTKSGIEIRPDGTVIVSSRGNAIHITTGDHKMLIKGEGNIEYQGNLKMHVTGNMDIEVGGDYNLRVHGDKNEEIRGGSSTTIAENKMETVTGDASTFVAGTNTDTYLSDRNLIVSATNTTRIGGNHNLFVGDVSTTTAKNKMTMSSENMSMIATDLTAVGNTGVLGGASVYHYGHNYFGTSGTFTEGVTAPTFHGNLKGLAFEASTTYSQTYPDTDPGGDVGSPNWSDGTHKTDTNTDKRVNTPSDLGATQIEDLLKNSDMGVRDVRIDPGDVLYNTINKSNNYNGVSKKPLTTEMVRSKLRDPNTSRNQKFIGRCISEGLVDASCVQQKPQKYEIGRILNQTGTSKFPQGKLLGNEESQPERISIEGNTITVRTLIPNQTYNPEQQLVRYGIINGKTKLAQNISLAKFLGGSGDPVTLEHITEKTERLKIARNLYAQAEFMNSAQEYLDKRNRHSLQVVEGLYKKEDGEILDVDGLNLLASRGQVVVYEVRDRKGQIDCNKTFDLAIYCKDYLNYDKMILDYDSYNPDQSLNAQIIIQMPPVSADWKMRYRNLIETRFNNYTQTNGELVEILPRSAIADLGYI